ncbi:hypothetical protein [Spirosoma areae]
MKLSLKPREIPFKVKDIVFINQPYAILNRTPLSEHDSVYFQAEIIRIFLDFSQKFSVVKERQDIHIIEVNTIMYDVKPIGTHEGLSRVAISIDLDDTEQKIFGSLESLLTYQAQQ